MDERYELAGRLYDYKGYKKHLEKKSSEKMVINKAMSETAKQLEMQVSSYHNRINLS